MENASKALVMAGGVLIGILILSLAVYLFADFGTTVAEINEQNVQQQIVQFNSRFTSYEGLKDDAGNWKITIYDIISLASYAKEYNEYYKDSGRDKIKVKLNGSDIQEENYQDLIDTYTAEGIITKFRCGQINYDNEGRVNEINFSEL